MEIKGTKEELEKLFKKKENKRFFNIPKFFKNTKFNKIQRRCILFLIMMTFFVFVNFVFIFMMYEFSGDYITEEECNSKVNQAYRDGILTQDLPPWILFIKAYEQAFAFLLFAIVLGWILHGVGFKLVGR